MAFADPRPGNLTEIRQSIALFGGVYIGLAMPLTAQKQKVWDVVAKRRTQCQAQQLGRPLRLCAKVRCDRIHLHHLGRAQRMTLAFWNKYCDEAHTLLSPDWIAAKGSPSGFDQAQLLADLKAIV